MSNVLRGKRGEGGRPARGKREGGGGVKTVECSDDQVLVTSRLLPKVISIPPNR